jgi:hypothetical protein
MDCYQSIWASQKVKFLWFKELKEVKTIKQFCVMLREFYLRVQYTLNMEEGEKEDDFMEELSIK